MRKEILIGVAACIIATAALSLVLFNMSAPKYSNVGTMGGMSGGMGSHDMGGMSGGMGSHDMGGMSGGMGHSMTTIQEMCHPASGMPPHYCDPTFQTMSSVAGIKIATAEPVSDTEVKVIIKENNADVKVSQKLVLAGGSGYLSGATIIEDGWDKSKVIHLKLHGTGTIYDFGQMHLHLFPITE